jgi:hypothetical protein
MEQKCGAGPEHAGMRVLVEREAWKTYLHHRIGTTVSTIRPVSGTIISTHIRTQMAIVVPPPINERGNASAPFVWSAAYHC